MSRTIAQQLSDVVKNATSPFQYALSTRAGCECIAHALQALCEQDPNATILSVDGIGAFDLVSHGAMLQGLHNVSPASVPFVRQDDGGVTHNIESGRRRRTRGPHDAVVVLSGATCGIVGSPASVEEG